MRYKKNGFFCFLFSFMPGAAEMYLGFMRCGISIMALFFVSFMIPMMLGLSDVFILVPTLIWFYAFFHARHYSHADEATLLGLEDTYIWTELYDGNYRLPSSGTVRNWIALFLIFFGISSLWRSITNVIYEILPDILWSTFYPIIDSIPRIALALLMIFLGLKMVGWRRRAIEMKPDWEDDADDDDDDYDAEAEAIKKEYARHAMTFDMVRKEMDEDDGEE